LSVPPRIKRNLSFSKVLVFGVDVAIMG